MTRVLTQVSAGVPEADARLLEIVYAELKRIAAAKMSAQDASHTLQPTALVHEAYLRLLGSASAPAFRGSAHFFTAAAAAMRSILVDHARRKQTLKRGGGVRGVFGHDPAGDDDPLGNVLQVHEALERLAVTHPRSAKIVELLFFAGLTSKEAASVLDVSDRTVEREWRFARAWLMRAMDDE